MYLNIPNFATSIDRDPLLGLEKDNAAIKTHGLLVAPHDQLTLKTTNLIAGWSSPDIFSG